MRALLLTAPDRFTVTDLPDPPSGDQAVVAVEVAGLCGTDSKIVSGAMPVPLPLVPGHEIVGRVQRPANGGSVAAGTRVLIDPTIPCRSCRQCRSGLGHLCPAAVILGVRSNGGLAELVAVSEGSLLPLPPSLPGVEAVLLQVLGTCVHAQRRVRVEPDETAVVVGLGTSGMLHVQLLRARGAGRIVAISRDRQKYGLAEELGADTAVHPDEAAGLTAPLIIESAGTAASFAQALDLAAVGGTVLAFGILAGGGTISGAHEKELRIVGARGAGPGDYTRAIGLAPRLRLGPLLSAVYPLEQADLALAESSAGRHRFKVAVEVGYSAAV